MTFDEPTSDYDDQMQGLQAGVLTYEQTHCKHGTFIGHWAGPDFMCFYCEMGVSDEEYAEILAERDAARKRMEHGLKGLRVLQRMSRRYEAAPTPLLQSRIVRLAAYLLGLS